MKTIITDVENFNISVAGDHKVIKPDREIKPCIGCFGCWVKTPGTCVILDGYENLGHIFSESDEVIIVSRCCFGSVSPFVKTVQDRALSYLSAHFTYRKGEMHHKRRYNNKLILSAWFYGNDLTEMEKETAKSLIFDNADNYDASVGEVQFFSDIMEMEGREL